FDLHSQLAGHFAGDTENLQITQPNTSAVGLSRVQLIDETLHLRFIESIFGPASLHKLRMPLPFRQGDIFGVVSKLLHLVRPNLLPGSPRYDAHFPAVALGSLPSAAGIGWRHG